MPFYLYRVRPSVFLYLILFYQTLPDALDCNLITIAIVFCFQITPETTN